MLHEEPTKKREQISLVCIDELVPQNHLLRKIDRVIDWSFIYDLVKEKYSPDFGRPSIDPVILIKIVLIQYLYLSAILDLYDRRIVSYVIRDTNDNPLVFDTFRAAIAANPDAHPLCHSDRGFQYTNRAFHRMLTKACITQSMSRVAKCIDNGPMEGFWGILKRERYYGIRFNNRASLVAMIEDFIHYYNTERLQRNLGVLTPMEKHERYFSEKPVATIEFE